MGATRFPSLGDQDNLPYVKAVATETLRWHYFTPLGFPHLTQEDDIYEGHLFPKDSLVIANGWWLLHDPEVYHDPMEFKPERFLGDKSEPDPRNVCFGYGRRVCPGRLLADSSMFLIIAQSLAAFNITKAIDETGKEIEPKVEFTPGQLSAPVELRCTVKPRSKQYEEMIQSVESEFPWEKSSLQALGNAQD